MIARKLAPALAAGCSFVGRPANQTPLTALAIAKVAERAGLPKGANLYGLYQCWSHSDAPSI